MKKKKIVITMGIILSLLVVSLFVCLLVKKGIGKDEQEENPINRFEELSDGQIKEEIEEVNHDLISDYLNDEGYIEIADVKNTSKMIYDFALELKEKGYVDTVTYCDESDVVAYYLNDNSVCLYIPHINQTYSGEDKYQVVSVETLDWLSDNVITGLDQLSRFRVAGSVDAAATIQTSLPDNYLHEKKEKDSFNTLDDLIHWIGGMNEDKARAIFWRGHGNIYTGKDGKNIAVWVMHIRSDETQSQKYREDIDNERVLFSDEYYVISSLFFDKYLPQMDGGLFFSGACETGNDGGDAAKIFIENHGFDAYIAPNGKIWTTYGDKLMGRCAEYLCGAVDGIRYNVSDALVLAKADVGEKDIYGVTDVLWINEENEKFELVPENSEKILTSYFEDELISTYGLFAKKQSGFMKQMEDNWMNPSGILAGKIMDFDNDKSMELLVIRTKKFKENVYGLLMEMYEVSDDKVVVADSVDYGCYTTKTYDTGNCDLLFTNECNERGYFLSVIQSDDKTYLFSDSLRLSSTFADGFEQNYWVMEYTGEKLNYVAAFAQTGGGSIDFEYTGVTFEDGQLKSSKLYYADRQEDGKTWDGEEVLYRNFYEAIIDFFSQYGIVIDKNMVENNPRLHVFSSILSEQNNMERIMGLTNRVVSGSWNTGYNFTAELYNTLN